jgi:hypothetical protein
LTSPKTRYSVEDLCKRMEVSEGKFYAILRTPGVNFPRPLNAATKDGDTIYYPADECDLWLANNDISALQPHRRKRGLVEDTLLVVSTGRSEVGSVVEFHSLAGSATIRAFLLSVKDKTEIHINHYPSRVFMLDGGWRNGPSR